jgi:broad specificity phosphatase PhoE
VSNQTHPLRLYLIRHGQTEWSISGQHTGRTDIPLTAHGEEEARSLAPGLSVLSFTHVFTSPRQRARDTCRLAGLGALAEIEPDLAEWDYGDYEGVRSSDIHKTRPDWNIFHDGCPNGETTVQAGARADRLIARLRALTGDIALFSHGHFGAVLAARWIGLPVEQGLHFPLHTASVSILGYDDSHPDIPVIAQWNGSPGDQP